MSLRGLVRAVFVRSPPPAMSSFCLSTMTSPRTCPALLQSTLPCLSSIAGADVGNRRHYWQEVVRGTTDRRDGRNRYEDPEAAAQRSARSQNAEGEFIEHTMYSFFTHGYLHALFFVGALSSPDDVTGGCFCWWGEQQRLCTYMRGIYMHRLLDAWNRYQVDVSSIRFGERAFAIGLFSFLLTPCRPPNSILPPFHNSTAQHKKNRPPPSPGTVPTIREAMDEAEAAQE